MAVPFINGSCIALRRQKPVTTGGTTKYYFSSFGLIGSDLSVAAANYGRIILSSINSQWETVACRPLAGGTALFVMVKCRDSSVTSARNEVGWVDITITNDAGDTSRPTQLPCVYIDDLGEVGTMVRGHHDTQSKK